MSKTGKLKCTSCDMCPPKIKKQMDGRTIEYDDRLDAHKMRRVHFKEGTEEKTRTCPDHSIKPGDVIAIDETSKAKREREEEERKMEEIANRPPMPAIHDYGYGPSCERCHAGRGECHSEDCPARKHVGSHPVC